MCARFSSTFADSYSYRSSSLHNRRRRVSCVCCTFHARSAIPTTAGAACRLSAVPSHARARARNVLSKHAALMCASSPYSKHSVDLTDSTSANAIVRTSGLAKQPLKLARTEGPPLAPAAPVTAQATLEAGAMTTYMVEGVGADVAGVRTMESCNSLSPTHWRRTSTRSSCVHWTRSQPIYLPHTPMTPKSTTCSRTTPSVHCSRCPSFQSSWGAS